MNGVELVAEIVEILTSGLVAMGTGIGEGVSALAQGIFLTGEPGAETMSVVGVLVVVFAGISLAIGLSRLIFHWISTLGARN